MPVFDLLFGKPDVPFTALNDAVQTATSAISAGEISRTDYNTLRRCYNAMEDGEKQTFDRAMGKPIIEDGDGIFNERGFRIG